MIRPARAYVLVKKAETEETLPGGRIVIPQDSREKLASHQVEVVAVGAPEICQLETCARRHEWSQHRQHMIPESLAPGAWALVRPRSFVEAGSETGLFFVRQVDVYAIFSVPGSPAVQQPATP